MPKIAHLSDLHFGSKKQKEQWHILAQYLRDVVKPDLILVTGDVADSASKSLFRKAKALLESLNIPFFMCAGNHDRFRHGIISSFPFFDKETIGQVFHDVFQGHALGPELSATRTLPQPELSPEGVRSPKQNSWSVRLFALDTSHSADFFARGYADPTDRQKLKIALTKSAAESEADLVIVLVHHHLLPVRQLEEKKLGSDLLNATAMVNAGSLLEDLATAHVDLVLHGHEHAPNWARYASVEAGGGETCIVAAGSGVGARSMEGCDIRRASFNVLHLDSAGAVSLEVIEHQNGSFRSDPERRLLWSPVALRKAQALRRSALELKRAQQEEKAATAVPFVRRQLDSEVTVAVDFLRSRDINIKEQRSRWRLSPEGTWTRVVRNTTGQPVSPELKVHSKQGPRSVGPSSDFAFAPTGEFYTWSLTWNAPDELRRETSDLHLRYSWMGGGILSAEEMSAMMDPARAGLFREKGKEYAALKPVSSVAIGRLYVSVPEELAPDTMEVSVTDLEDHDRELKDEANELRSSLQELGQGRYLLEVPYPRPNCRYSLVWTPPSLKRLFGRRQFMFWNQLNRPNAANRVADEVRQVLLEAGISGTVSLFVPRNRREIEMGTVSSDQLLEAELVAHVGNSHPHRHASFTDPGLAPGWWGKVYAERSRDPDDPEMGFLLIPLTYNVANDVAPLGVIRVGVHDVLGEDSQLLADKDGSKLSDLLTDTIVRGFAALRG